MWFRITLFGKFNFPVSDLFHSGFEIEDFPFQIKVPMTKLQKVNVTATDKKSAIDWLC
jgi:hypothetical protein